MKINSRLCPIWLQKIVVFGSFLTLIFLSFYNQPYYPTTWFDEGLTLQGAMNLARYGQYAMRSSEGFRVLDQPLLANGPGVVLPITVIYKLFGVGLIQARVFMSIFLVATVLVFFATVNQLFGFAPALLSSFFLLALPQEGILLLGRNALGLVPSLGYFFGGFYLWLKAIEHDNWLYTIVAGALWGIATVTKGQYLLLIPMLLLVGLADWFYYKKKIYRKVFLVLLLIAISLGIWYGMQLIVEGSGQFVQNLHALRASSAVTVTSFRSERLPGNIWYLFRSGILFIILPSWLYIVWSCKEFNLVSVQLLLPVIFVPAWLVWYSFASVGWHRYALDPYVIGVVFTGKFLVDAVCTLRARELSSCNETQFPQTLSAGFILVIFGASLWGFSSQVTRIFEKPDTSPQLFSDFLQKYIRSNEVIESWEWEIDVMTPELTYHHPSNDWVDKMTAVLQFGDPLVEEYDLFEYNPDFLINGPFSKWTGLYSKAITDACCTLIKKIGPYDLYQVSKSW
jgi:hypothetical protein